MFRRHLREEAGYSLVEVMASIIILAIAIIPMVGMFDMGLNAATTSSNYDKARALANSNMEKVRSLPYSTAQVSYRPLNAAPTPGTAVSCNQSIFTCTVTTNYVNNSFNPDPTVTTKMRVVVTVQWNSGNFTTTGLKARSQ